MSSADEECNEGENPSGVAAHGSKKRRIQRACDVCRRKKIRCDGAQMPGNRCSNCISYKFNCTYVEAAKKRGPPKGYVESLETRLEKMERLLYKLCPEGDFSQELGQLDTEPRPPELFPVQTQTSKPSPSTASSTTLNSAHMTAGSPEEEGDLVQSEDDFTQMTLEDNLKRLTLEPAQERFFGKSSGVMLVQTALDLKNMYTGKATCIPHKREEYWNVRPWELTLPSEDDRPHYTFPDEDLMAELVPLYFQYTNTFCPLLHRPTFERAVAEKLHRKDDLFGATLLLVCAVASRHSDDPRVILEGTDSRHSSGWQWFQQVQMVRKSLLAPPALYDLQFYCLSVLFLRASSAPQACWTMVGIGIRLAQDVGAHRRKIYNRKPTVEDELWKRAFWVLVCIDRVISSALGRPCALQDEDFDLDLPIEVDDEYWETPDPEQAFKQPPGKPSTMAYFISYLKLNQILAFALRTIYSINKSKILLGFGGQQWEQHIVAELDSALNKWVDGVPDHLRWDPNRENQIFFDQSAILYSKYYHLQILIHRPFIPSPRKPSPLSFPSLAICTNAARSCSHIIDISRSRSVTLPTLLMPAFTSGIVLLLHIWGGKRSGLATDSSKEMADIHKCMQYLRHCEDRWHTAGRFWDILYELASVGDLPLPQSSPISTNKRERESDSPISATFSSVNNSRETSTFGETTRPTAGTRRVSSSKEPSIVPSQGMQPQPTMQPYTLPNVSLPMYSGDLGRVPLHENKDSSGHAKFPAGTNDWYAELLRSGSMSGPISDEPRQFPFPNGISGAPTSSDTGTFAGGVYPTPQLSFDQMAAGFTAPFGRGAGLGQAPYQHQSLDSGLQPRGPSHPNPLLHHRPPNPHEMPNPYPVIDSDTMAMWSNAPSGFELADWDSYIANVTELTQGLPNSISRPGTL